MKGECKFEEDLFDIKRNCFIENRCFEKRIGFELYYLSIFIFNSILFQSKFWKANVFVPVLCIISLVESSCINLIGAISFLLPLLLFLFSFSIDLVHPIKPLTFCFYFEVTWFFAAQVLLFRFLCRAEILL